jgi:hypothetical protein
MEFSGIARPLSAAFFECACQAMDDLHEFQVFRAFIAKLIRQRGSRAPQQLALPPDAQFGMILLHGLLSPVPRMILHASAKKSGSTTS